MGASNLRPACSPKRMRYGRGLRSYVPSWLYGVIAVDCGLESRMLAAIPLFRLGGRGYTDVVLLRAIAYS